MEAYGVIYRAEFPKGSGKMYVGATTRRLKARIKQHMETEGCIAFSNAIKKYGKPLFIVICSVQSQEELDRMEKHWIKELNTLVPDGYNLKEGGSNGKYSTSSRRKMSNSHKGKKNHNFGKPRSEEARKNISRALTGKKRGPLSDEHKEKLSIAFSGENNHNFGKSGELGWHFGKSHTLETREKIAASRKKLSNDDIEAIRKAYAQGDTSQAKLAKEYGVSKRTVGRTIHRKSRLPGALS